MAWRRTSTSRVGPERGRQRRCGGAGARAVAKLDQGDGRPRPDDRRAVGRKGALERGLRVSFHSPESPGGFVARDRVDRGYSYGPGPVGDCRQQGPAVCAGGQEANAIHRHRPDRVARVAQVGGQQRLAGRLPGASDRECRPGGDPLVGGAEPPPQGSVSQRTLALKG